MRIDVLEGRGQERRARFPVEGTAMWNIGTGVGCANEQGPHIFSEITSGDLVMSERPCRSGWW
jgi:hypothetical protein